MGLFGKKMRIKPKTVDEQWCMALGAMYVEENNTLADVDEIVCHYFEDGELDDDGRASVRKEAVDQFCRLDMNMGTKMGDSCRELLRESWEVTDKASALKALEWLRTQGHRAEANDPKVLAWDMARYIHLTRLAFLADYLQDEEAWAKAVEIKSQTQSGFSSWRSFAQGFTEGRNRWAGQRDPSLDRAIADLIEHRVSPWVHIPWTE